MTVKEGDIVFAYITDPDGTPWQPGITPKDLMDMRMLDEQRAALKKEAEEQRTFRDSEAKRNQRWRIMELLVMGGIVTLVSIGAQIGAAFIERGSLFPAKSPTDASATDPSQIAD